MQSQVCHGAAGPYAIWWLPPPHLTASLSALAAFVPDTWAFFEHAKPGPAQNLSLLFPLCRMFFPIFTWLSISGPSHLCSLITSSEGPFQMALSKAAALCFAIYISLFYFLDSTYKWYHTVFFWLISLSIIFSKFIHIAANGRISFFFYSWIIFHCICIYIFYTHLSVDGHLGCFHT